VFPEERLQQQPSSLAANAGDGWEPGVLMFAPCVSPVVVGSLREGFSGHSRENLAVY